jgi:tetratricopeptide (TPR) repeat protein
LIKFAKTRWPYFITLSCNVISTQQLEIAMFRRNCLATFLVLAGCAASLDRSLASDQCSLELLEASAARAAEACTSVLNQDDATTASRVNALKIRGRAMQRLDRYDDAIADYETGLRIAPEDAELHLRRGWTAYEELRLGWWGAAGLGLDPDLERAFNLALDQAREALRLKPDYAEAYSLIGAAVSLGAPERVEEVKAAMGAAISLEPTDPKFWFDRLTVLKKYRLFREAIEDANAILRLPADLTTKPSAAESYLRKTTFRIATAIERAELLRAVGRTSEAGQAYDQAVALDPDPITYTRRASFKLSQIAFLPGMPPPPLDAIQDDLDRALALDPDYWVSHEQQAHLHSIRGKNDLAATELALALKQFPGNGGMRWQHALVLRKLGRGEEAAEEAITSFRMDPGFMINKLGMLTKRGYLAAISPDTDPRPALMDAARACMLDEECG